jgi:hypothetical protein
MVRAGGPVPESKNPYFLYGSGRILGVRTVLLSASGELSETAEVRFRE